jgi:hypothetical protein
LPDIGRLGEPLLPSATIHPVRCLSKGLSSSKIRGFVPESQDPNGYLTGQGCSATPQMDSLRNHQTEQTRIIDIIVLAFLFPMQYIIETFGKFINPVEF